MNKPEIDVVKMKNIAMDIAFTIETEKNFEELTAIEVLSALLERITRLMNCWEADAIGFCDEYEMGEKALTPLEAERKFGVLPKGAMLSSWLHHPDYPMKEWAEEARNLDIKSSYWEWVIQKMEEDKDWDLT